MSQIVERRIDISRIGAYGYVSEHDRSMPRSSCNGAPVLELWHPESADQKVYVADNWINRRRQFATLRQAIRKLNKTGDEGY